MADLVLNDVSLRIKHGNKEDLPSSAPESELLIVIEGDKRSLYCGTGDSVVKLNDDSNKLNITLDNATQTTKETIVDYNGIDYDMGINIPSSQLFTPEKDGVIISLSTTGGVENGVQVYKSNSTDVQDKIGESYTYRNGYSFTTAETRVTKGKEYNIVLTNPSWCICNFYPCNGVKE